MDNPLSWVDPLGLAKKCKLPEILKFGDEGVSHVKERHIGNNADWDHKSKWTISNAQWKTTSRDVFRNPDGIIKDGDRFIYEKHSEKILA